MGNFSVGKLKVSSELVQIVSLLLCCIEATFPQLNCGRDVGSSHNTDRFVNTWAPAERCKHMSQLAGESFAFREISPEHQFECSDEGQSHSLGFKLRSAREGTSNSDKHPKQQNQEFVCHRRTTVHVSTSHWQSLSHSIQAHFTRGVPQKIQLPELITSPAANRAICAFS